MGKVTASTDIDKVSDEDVSRYVEIVVEDIVNQINGNLTFAENIRGQLLSVTFSSANTQVQINHNLGRVPQGYLVSTLSAAAIIYNGDTSASTAAIYLKSSAPVTVGLFIF